MGGLGNQMFQWAFAKSLSIRKNEEFSLDVNSFAYDRLRKFELGHFNLKDKIASVEEIQFSKRVNRNLYLNYFKKLFRVGSTQNEKVEIEKSLNYDASVQWSAAKYFEGYWQSEKYFMECEQEIRNDFKICIESDEYYTELHRQAEKTESVSVHFRRGDYINNSSTNQYHGTCSLDYYKNAMNYIKVRLGSEITFFMISDDIAWVKSEFESNKGIIFVENDQGLDVEDMLLMTRCKHNIIANSSFSWWGAWLNENENKVVIAPKIWFRNEEVQKQTLDLIPEKWVRI